MRKTYRFTKKVLGRVFSRNNVKRAAITGLGVMGVVKSYRFYDEYAIKKEGLRRLKKHFYDEDKYVRIKGMDFVEFWNSDYVVPMIHLEPNTLDEVIKLAAILEIIYFILLSWMSFDS